MKRLFECFLRAWALRRTRHELYSLSDHMLRDIGLRREEIPSALLQRVVLAEPRLAQAGTGGLVAKADRRSEVPAS
jgi:uncharacterized protein YjiS (DUF1127 family)